MTSVVRRTSSRDVLPHGREDRGHRDVDPHVDRAELALDVPAAARSTSSAWATSVAIARTRPLPREPDVATRPRRGSRPPGRATRRRSRARRTRARSHAPRRARHRTPRRLRDSVRGAIPRGLAVKRDGTHDWNTDGPGTSPHEHRLPAAARQGYGLRSPDRHLPRGRRRRHLRPRAQGPPARAHRRRRSRAARHRELPAEPDHHARPRDGVPAAAVRPGGGAGRPRRGQERTTRLRAQAGRRRAR